MTTRIALNKGGGSKFKVTGVFCVLAAECLVIFKGL